MRAPRGSRSCRAGRTLVVGCGAIGLLWTQVLLRARPRGRRGRRAAGPACRGRSALGAVADGGPVTAAVVTAAAGLDDALHRLEPGGVVLVFAGCDGPLPVSLDAVYRRELTIVGSRSASPASFAAAVEVLPHLELPTVDDAATRAVRRRRRAVSQRRGAQSGVHAVKAALLYAPGDLRVEEVPRPEPGPGEVLVQVEVALTDGTDLKTYRRGHPLLARTSPAPFGHEFCGFVDGRRVVAANSAPCQACDGCARGEQCRELVFLAGAYAEWLVVPERIAAVNLHDVPARSGAGGRGDGRAAGVLLARHRARRPSRPEITSRFSAPGRSA